MIIFLTSRWFINFARFSFETTFLLLLELVSTYYFLKFYYLNNTTVEKETRIVNQDKNTNQYLLVAGIFSGLSYLSYTPGRIFFLIPLYFLLINIKSVFFNRSKDTNNNHNNNYDNKIDTNKNKVLAIKQLLWFIVPFIIVITPLTAYLLTHQDTRVDQLFFWKNHEMTINEKVEGTFNNLKTISLMFITNGDLNGKHNYPAKPALNPIMAGLF